MIRYAVRVTPGVLLGASCAVIAGLMAMVAARPYVMWPLQGAAVGLIAGTVATAQDERCAALVDTLPRGLVWRTAARAVITVPAALGVWACCLLVWRHRLPDHPGLFALQGVGAATLAVSVSAWRRHRGVPQPGAVFAALVVPVATAVALIRPWSGVLALFPIWPADEWGRSRALWLALTAGAPLAALLAAVRSRRRCRGRPRGRGRWPRPGWRPGAWRRCW
ncbi:hypothetical protein [Actinomadura chibensis]|uniref:ABC transporter n=1 Tax=Actinomadura chibensis TaxID=392828 RepID=A0A5D0NNE3_9ACTN|nr:hypothetical protein [Actinomadura chibensis]TYB45531.1 hypothetical protein FXF69_19055 [Actinomadura chibensis]